MLSNKLKVNAGKTRIMTVGTKTRLDMQASQVSVTMDGIVLQKSVEDFETMLGCHIEPTLKWHKQVEELLKKLKTRLTALDNLRSIISFHLHQCSHLLSPALCWL